MSGPCDNIIIDGSNSQSPGGNFAVIWSSSDPTLNATLSALTSHTITLTPQALPQENFKYNIALVVIGLVSGRKSQIVTQTVVRGSLPFPNLSIKGPSIRRISPTESVLLQGSVAFSSCAQELQLNFTWSQVDGPQLSVDKIIIRGMNLFIKPLSIPVQKSVTFQLSAFPAIARDSMMSSTTVQVKCVLPPLSSIILGGSHRTIGLASRLVLNGSLSHDPAGVSSILSYQWSCVYQQQPCRSRDSNLVSLSMNSVLSVDMSSLDVQVGSDLQFFLLVSSLNRQSLASVQLRVSELLPASLALVPLVPALMGRSGTHEKGYDVLVNANERMILQAQTDESFDALSWQSNPLVNLSSFIVNKYLIVPPTQSDKFAGKIVVFKASSNDSESSTSISVFFNRPPSLGRCQVIPVHGIALETQFKISCNSWVDDQSDGLITYAFGLGQSCSANKSAFTNRSDYVDLRSQAPTNWHSFVTGTVGRLCLKISVCDQ